jgi:hypothetical protein
MIKSKIGNSKIHGIGLFADEFIPKGTILFKKTRFDLEFDKKDLEELSEPAREQILKYSYKQNNKYILAPDDSRYVNHSSNNPNADGSDPEIDIALRDICPGEEILEDYRLYDESFAEKV